MGHKHESVSPEKSQGEKRTAFVVIFSATTMVLEIIFGLFSNSMALLADGIHMGSHVLAIGLSWLSLSAYTSGILLLMFAIFIIIEAAERFFTPAIDIKYTEAMIVAAIGMVVNIICAFVLHDNKGHQHEDYNRHSAYLHVVADALTSLGAIFGLICAMIWDITWIDTLVAVVCSAVIIRWAKNLLFDTGKILTSKAYIK